MSSEEIKQEIKNALQRDAAIHKGDCGRVFVIAGSPGMTGAAALVCRAALRSGAGLITLGIPQSLNSVMEVKLTEAMTLPLAETEAGTLGIEAYPLIRDFLRKQDVLVIGPGLSQHAETQKCIREIVVNACVPVVLDADGLNAFVGFTEMLAKIKSSVIITPHPAEFSRLFDIPVNEVQDNRVALASDYSLKNKLTIVLKGCNTVVAQDGHRYVNSTGNPGLATGGTGDVLSGMIGAFLGQGMSQYDAARYAVYLHGYAADIIAREKSTISLIASDIIDTLPYVFKECGL